MFLVEEINHCQVYMMIIAYYCSWIRVSAHYTAGRVHLHVDGKLRLPALPSYMTNGLLTKQPWSLFLHNAEVSQLIQSWVNVGYQHGCMHIGYWTAVLNQRTCGKRTSLPYVYRTRMTEKLSKDDARLTISSKVSKQSPTIYRLSKKTNNSATAFRPRGVHDKVRL